MKNDLLLQRSLMPIDREETGTDTLTIGRVRDINKLTAYGKCIQSNLPYGYTELEYLESSGTQYIDTGRIPNNTDIIEQAFQTKNSYTASTLSWYGSLSDTGGAALPRISLGWYSGGFFCGVNSTANLQQQIDNNKHIVKFYLTETSDFQSYWDGQQVAFIHGSYLSPTIDLTSYLFARHGDNGINVTDGLGTKIYYHKEYLSDETLVLNLIPARRNSDNVLGMYDKVSGNFLVNSGTGSFIAGPDVVPSPSNPIDIWCNNGVLKLSPNLLPKPTASATDYFIPQVDGSVVCQGTPTGYVVYNYAEISTGLDFTKTYTFGFTGTLINIRLDVYIVEANTVLSQYAITPTTYYKTVDLIDFPTADKIRVNVARNVNDQTMSGTMYPYIIEGSSPISTWHPYGEIYTDGLQETISVHGKNLFDCSQSMVMRNNSFSNLVHSNGTITYDNTSPWASQYLGGYFIANIGTEYTISFIRVNASYNEVHIFQSDTLIDSVGTNYGTNVASGGKFTASKKYIYIWIVVSQSQSGGVTNLQLEQGSTATSYEPYFNGGTVNCSDLLSVGNYIDSQEILGGVVTRNVGVVVLDGTENWNYATNSTHYGNYFNIFITDFGLLNENRIAAFSNLFNGVEASYAYIHPNEDYKIWVEDGNKLRLNYFNFTTTTALKQWLSYQYAAGTPVIVVYPLATPTQETVDGQSIDSQIGTNIIDVSQASLGDLNFKVRYRQK